MRTALALALTVFAGSACSAELPQDGRGVLVIAVDALRADHLSSYGYDRETTPELDELARDGVRFDNAWSAAPALFAANAALLTGCDPGIARRYLPPELPSMLLTHWNVPEEAPHVAYELLRRGWRTAAFVDDAAFHRALGIARGFRELESFDAAEVEEPGELGAALVLDRFSRWLLERKRDERWFAYVHLSDLSRVWRTHDPTWDTYFQPRGRLNFVPPTGEAPALFHAITRSRWTGGLRTLGEYEAEYDGALRKLDAALGRTFDLLRANGRLERTTIVVVGTRGVGFGEAGMYLDAGTLADCDLHVPLIVRPAAGIESQRGAVSHALASTVDLAPTLLELAQAPVPAEMQGVSLASVLRILDAPTRPFAFASGAYQDGQTVIGPSHCLETSRPWRVDDPALALSWYGGPPPANPELRVVFHDREQDRSVGHARSAPLDEGLAAEMHAAARRWDEEVEILRRRFQAPLWLGFGTPAIER